MIIELREVIPGDVYQITLYLPNKHVGGTKHKARYSCGFWHDLDGNLIALHRDVKEIELRPEANHANRSTV